MKSYVLDACSVIAYLNDEKGAEVVANLIRNCKKGKCSLHLHRLTYLEIYLDILRVATAKDANKLDDLISELKITTSYDLSDKVVQDAAYLKSTFRMSLADSVLLGFSKTIKAEVVTSDHHEFDIVESKTKVKFKWIR